MKIIATLFLLFNTIVFANSNYELKLYEKVLPLVFNNITMLIYADKNSQKIIKESDVFKLIPECDDAVLLIGKNFDNLKESCKRKPIFSTSYRSYKNEENSIGAFYWRKGRPQLKFNISNINKFNLFIPKDLKKYCE